MIEGHEIIHRKVPDHCYAHSDQFGDVEVKLHTIWEDINEDAGDDQACGHDPCEFHGLNSYLIIMDAPGPHSVQSKVVRSRYDESQSICDVFISFYFFFEKVGTAKVNAESRAADDDKLAQLL